MRVLMCPKLHKPQSLPSICMYLYSINVISLKKFSCTSSISHVTNHSWSNSMKHRQQNHVQNTCKVCVLKKRKTTRIFQQISYMQEIIQGNSMYTIGAGNKQGDTWIYYWILQNWLFWIYILYSVGNTWRTFFRWMNIIAYVDYCAYYGSIWLL